MKMNLSGLSAVVGFGLAPLVVAGGGFAALHGKAPGATASEETQRIVQDGVAVELTVARSYGESGPILEGSDAELTLSLTDAETGEPIPGLTLAAWVDREREGEEDEPRMCRDRIESYLQADLKTRPVLDLNSYVVLALNDGPTISVIDPFIGFGTTNLYARVALPSRGEDWALDASQTHLFVTMPALNQVAVVSADTWRVERSIDVGRAPHDVELQPDGQGVWVLDGGPEIDGEGVTVIDPSSLAVKGRVVTGAGNRRIAFSEDGQVAYVANRDAGTVSIIDVATVSKLADIETGPRPMDVSFSKTASAAYVVDEEDGSVTAIDRDTHTMRMRVVTNPGITTVGFDPMMGRWGFVLNTRENVAHVIDGAHDQIVHTLTTAEGPDQISYTHSFAYIRALGSSDVTMVPFASLREGLYDEGLWPFPAGALPPGNFDGSGPAAAIVRSPEMHDAVYVANPGEKRIYVYHYMEGMPTPSGTLDNYGQAPRAVMTVGRSIQEVSAGVYKTTVKAPPQGEYDFVFLLEDPRIIHCFDLDVAEDPDKVADDGPIELDITPVDGSGTLTPGTTSEITFELRERESGKVRAGLKDVQILLLSPAGWQRRLEAERRPRGNYRLEVAIPASVTGTVYMFAASPSLGTDFDRQRPTVLQAVAAR